MNNLGSPLLKFALNPKCTEFQFRTLEVAVLVGSQELAVRLGIVGCLLEDARPEVVGECSECRCPGPLVVEAELRHC